MIRYVVSHWLGWLSALACAWVCFAFTHSAAVLWCLVLLCLIAAVWSVGAFFAARHAEPQLSVPTGGEKGQEIPCNLTIRGRKSGFGGICFCKVRLKNELTGEEDLLEIRVSAGETVPFSFCADHCGRMEITVMNTAVPGLSGLIPWISRKETSSRLTVLPETFPTEVRLQVSPAEDLDAEEYTPDHRGEDRTELYQIREYVPGDSLKQIHWKLSSKLDRLVIREASQPVLRSVLLFWDKRGDGASLDAQAEALFSVSQSLAEQGCAFTLGWGDGEHIRFAQVRSADDLLREMPLLLTSGQTDASWEDSFHGFGKILWFSGEMPGEQLNFGGAEPVFLICGQEVSTVGNAVWFSVEDYAAALQYLEL